MLEKGFSNPTDRVVRLRNMILTAKRMWNQNARC